MQLQPAVAVTKAAYLKLYPDDQVTAKYVIVNGCRRLAAAHQYGRTDLAVVVNDEIARDRVTLISASISENVDRQDFDVIEEAKAVQALVAECGRADEAAKRLHKTESWVSQRRACCPSRPSFKPHCDAASWRFAKRDHWRVFRSSNRWRDGGLPSTRRRSRVRGVVLVRRGRQPRRG